MRAEDDELWRVTAEQAEKVRRSDCDDLEMQLLSLQREHRLLQDEHSQLKVECEDRLNALRRLSALEDITEKSTALDQIIARVRNTIYKTEEVT